MDARWLGRRRRRPAPGSRLRGTGATSMAAQGCAKNGATTVSNSGSSIQGTRGLARGCALIRRRPAGGSFQRNEVAARQRELPTGARCAPGWPPSGVKRFGFHEGGKGRFGRWAMAFFSERGRLNGKGQVTRRAGQGQGRSAASTTMQCDRMVGPAGRNGRGTSAEGRRSRTQRPRAVMRTDPGTCGRGQHTTLRPGRQAPRTLNRHIRPAA